MISENEFTMVSDWMVNGNINQFIVQSPDANRIALVGFALAEPSLPRLIDH